MHHFHSCHYHIDNEEIEMIAMQIWILLVESYKNMPGSTFLLIIPPEGKILKEKAHVNTFRSFILINETDKN